VNDPSFFSLFVLPWLIKIGFAGVIAVAGYYLTKVIVQILDKAMTRASIDAMLRKFALSITKSGLLLFVAIAALSQLGLNTTSLVALVGAAGIAVGLALKDSLGNLASGVMLLIFRPFTIGHFIEGGGTMGTVTEIGIFHTRLLTTDGREVIVPNGALYNNKITNFSTQPTRRVEITVSIDYEDNIAEAKQIIEKVLAEESRILPDPAPVVLVGSLAESGIDLIVRAWVKRTDFLMVQSDLQEQIKNAFDAAGITIPYPQLVLHQINTKSQAA